MIKEYAISIQTLKEDGELKFRIFGLCNSNIRQEVWGFWFNNISDAFTSFEEELKK